jgi:hypothetical protein
MEEEPPASPSAVILQKTDIGDRMSKILADFDDEDAD